MDDEDDNPSEPMVRLTALQLALEFNSNNPKASAAGTIEDATAFMAFLKGDNANV